MTYRAGPRNHPIIKYITISAAKHIDRHIKRDFQRPQIVLHWFKLPTNRFIEMFSVFTDFWTIELWVKIVDCNFLKCGNFNL